MTFSGTRRESIHGGSTKTSLFLKVPEKVLTLRATVLVTGRSKKKTTDLNFTLLLTKTRIKPQIIRTGDNSAGAAIGTDH